MKKIVVLQRGWIVVGDFSQDGEMCTLENASVIRKWGTTKGLGELINGPLEDTILDYEGTCHFHILTTIRIIDCESGW